jgi:hypothetical protein
VFPARDLDVDLYRAGAADAERRVITFEARQGGVTVIKNGRAELVPD